MNVQTKSRLLATLAATLAGMIGNQILGLSLASFQAGSLKGMVLILANIAIGAVVLKALHKSTPLWAALLANVFAFFVINRLFASGNFAPSSNGLVVYVVAIIVSYWIAQFAALRAIELIATRMNAAKHSS